MKVDLGATTFADISEDEVRVSVWVRCPEGDADPEVPWSLVAENMVVPWRIEWIEPSPAIVGDDLWRQIRRRGKVATA